MTQHDGVAPSAGDGAASPTVGSAVRGAVRSLAILGGGRILARILMAAAVPLLARFYDAADFGIYGIFVTASAAFTLAAAFCYEQGIVPASSDVEAARLTYLSLLLVLLTCAALAIVLALFGPLLLRVSHIEGLAPVILLVPLGIAANAAVEVLLHAANRGHRDRLISATSLLRVACMLAVQFGASWLAISHHGLILGHIAGSAVAIILLCGGLRWQRLPQEAGRWWRQLIDTARRLSVLPRLGAPRAAMIACVDILVISLLTELFGAVDVGLYWMALRIVKLPSQVMDQPVLQFFYRSAAAAQARGDRIVKLLLATMLGLAVVAVPFVLTLQFGAEFLFGRVLGAEWIAAAFYAKILCIGWMVEEIALPLTVLPILLGRLKFQFFYEATQLAMRLAAVFIAYAFDSFVLFLVLFAAIESCMTLFFGSVLAKPIAAVGRPAAHT